MRVGLPLLKMYLQEKYFVTIRRSISSVSYRCSYSKENLLIRHDSINIFNDVLNNIVMKIVKPLKDSGLLIKGVTETVENEVKKQKGRFLLISAATLGATLLGNMLTPKGMKSKILERKTTILGLEVSQAGEETIRAGKTIRAAQDFWCHLVF